MSRIAIQGGEEAVFNNLPSKSKRMNSHDIAELVTVGERVLVRPLPKGQEGIPIMAEKKFTFMAEGEEPATVRNFRVMLQLSLYRSYE